MGGSAGGDYMEQYAGMDMGGSSGSASETIRWKLSRFYGWLPTAQLIWWELYFVSSGCLRPALNIHPGDCVPWLLHRRLRMNVMGLGAIIDIGAKTVTSGIIGFTFSGGTYQSVFVFS